MLDDYRTRYFAGDGQALANFVLAQLRMRDIETGALQDTLEQDGYDAFIVELLAQVHMACSKGTQERLLASEKPAEHQEGVEPPNDTTDEITEKAAPTNEAHSERALKLAILPPTVAVLLMGLLNFSLTQTFTWAVNHRPMYMILSVVIAVLPALLGILVDAPIAWHAYIKENEGVPFSWEAFRRVAKYGAPQGIVAGAGRFNLTLPYLAYQPICNLITVACHQSLFSLMLALPGFEEYFCSHRWIEYLKAGIAISFFISWEFLRDQCKKPLVGDPESEICENPDNYLPSRVHMWANTFCLVWTITIIIVGLISVLAYGLKNFRSLPVPAELAFTYAQAMLFYAYSNLSPYAVKTQATGIGTLVPGVLAISIGFALMSITCFLPSLAGVFLCIACAACSFATLIWKRSAKESGMASWLATWRTTGIYPVVVTATIFGLLALGFFTLSFA
ncbi:MAG: hypothetical protein Q4B54_09020 [Coriobacteriales bacterium]|nr:hypothetical protein [Coriobacteriales bacterium]